jgi:hypothetical protein
MVDAIKSLSKGAEIMIYQGVLLRQRVSELREANKAATQRKLHKRKRVQKQGTVTVEDCVRLTTLKEFGARSDGKKAKKRVCIKMGKPSQRRCRRCSKMGHSACTCKKDTEGILD